MKAQGRERRYQRQLALGCALVKEQMYSIRKAAERVKIPLSTLWREVRNKRNKVTLGAPTALTENEENGIVTLINDYADRGRPFSRKDIADMVEILVSRMSSTRRKKIRFRGGRPGRDYLKNFLRRHQSSIRLAKVNPQEQVRFAAVNAENITAHLARIGDLCKRHNIDPSRIHNLDETGISPGDMKRQRKTKYFVKTGGRAQIVLPKLKAEVSHITMMPTVSADGKCFNPYFILKGQGLRWKEVGRAGERFTESVVNFLPAGSLITTRENIAGVDKQNFLRWVPFYLQQIGPLLENGRKVLLIYDGYKSHLDIRVLETLKEAGVIAYALPAHTSGTTQPLDVAVFAPFKAALKDQLLRSAQSWATTLSLNDFASIITEAYDRAFTRVNIKSGFRKTGICPFDPRALLSHALPADCSPEDENRVLSPGSLMSLYNKKKRSRMRRRSSAVLIRQGTLDTSSGVTLTSENAMCAIKQCEESKKKKWQAKKAREKERKDRREARSREKEQHEERALQKLERQRSLRRSKARPLALRREIAKSRTAARREKLPSALSAGKVDIQLF